MTTERLLENVRFRARCYRFSEVITDSDYPDPAPEYDVQDEMLKLLEDTIADYS